MADVATLPEPLEEVAPPRGQHGAAAWAVWLARRLGLAVLTLWLVSVLVFVATTALGDPVRAILGRDYNANPGAGRRSSTDAAEPRRVARQRATSTGSAACSPVTWAPRSPTSSRSAELIGHNVVNTLVLVLLSAMVMIPLAFGIAMISAQLPAPAAATRSSRRSCSALAGLPEFVIGILLVALFSTTVFHWLPGGDDHLADGGHPGTTRSR